MTNHKTIISVVADDKGQVFEHPNFLVAGMNGNKIVAPEISEMVPLPEGSRLFTIPQTPPMGIERRTGKEKVIYDWPNSWHNGPIQAVSAFLAPGYTRTLLPAADYSKKKKTLPLWSYTAVGWCVEEERFYTAAIQVDRNPQWNPDYFDDRKLEPLVRKALRKNPRNRLLTQLSRCALDYHCFAAKNLFLKRWEAPLPTSPSCNSRCIGCISYQESDCCPASQERLTFVPTVGELCELAVPHLSEADNAIVSFGQGCEGDPILQSDLIAVSIKKMRQATALGTINFNSNASLPGKINQLASAGMDSIRVSMNSARKSVYNAYYRPVGYEFNDVIESLKRAKGAGVYTMLNYLVFPGVTDQEEEVAALTDLIGEVGVDMIQLRNLSIDPTLYLAAIQPSSYGSGMLKMIEQLKQLFPKLQFGYFNRTKETFFTVETDARDQNISNSGN